MKPGERFTFRVIPSSICGNRRRVGDSSELSIPIGDDAWWNKKFMTKASLGEGVNTWYFMALNPSYKNIGGRVAYGPPFIFQKMYADIDLEGGRGVVGKPFEFSSTGGSFNLSMLRMNWLSNYDIFLISNESSLMNWDFVPWGDKK
jgi:hypothetical protein